MFSQTVLVASLMRAVQTAEFRFNATLEFSVTFQMMLAFVSLAASWTHVRSRSCAVVVVEFVCNKMGIALWANRFILRVLFREAYMSKLYVKFVEVVQL